MGMQSDEGSNVQERGKMNLKRVWNQSERNKGKEKNLKAGFSQTGSIRVQAGSIRLFKIRVLSVHGMPDRSAT